MAPSQVLCSQGTTSASLDFMHRHSHSVCHLQIWMPREDEICLLLLKNKTSLSDEWIPRKATATASPNQTSDCACWRKLFSIKWAGRQRSESLTNANEQPGTFKGAWTPTAWMRTRSVWGGKVKPCEVAGRAQQFLADFRHVHLRKEL